MHYGKIVDMLKLWYSASLLFRHKLECFYGWVKKEKRQGMGCPSIKLILTSYMIAT